MRRGKLKHGNFVIVGVHHRNVGMTLPYNWLCGTVGRKSVLAGELSLSYAWPTADG